MRFQVMTLFPEMIAHAVQYGVVGQAIKQQRITIQARSPREFTTNVHQTIDDRPFGGGDGMIMMAEPASLALSAMKEQAPEAHVIHLSPRGRQLTDERARKLTQFKELILISSRYGGLDERFLNDEVDEEISIGDYILSGGELGALVVIDTVARLLPGVLGNAASSEEESFRSARLEAPQYTRPREWRGQSAPEILLSGDHARIAKWRAGVSLMLTLERRPDLIRDVAKTELRSALEIIARAADVDLQSFGIRDGITLRDQLKDLARKSGIT